MYSLWHVFVCRKVDNISGLCLFDAVIVCKMDSVLAKCAGTSDRIRFYPSLPSPFPNPPFHVPFFNWSLLNLEKFAIRSWAAFDKTEKTQFVNQLFFEVMGQLYSFIGGTNERSGNFLRFLEPL